MYPMSTTDQVIARARARRTVRVAPALARDLRLQAELTLSDVAGVLGVSHVAVSRWERGLRVPRGAMAERYLELLRRAAETR